MYIVALEARGERRSAATARLAMDSWRSRSRQTIGDSRTTDRATAMAQRRWRTKVCRYESGGSLVRLMVQ
jgi:hypothetical protein